MLLFYHRSAREDWEAYYMVGLWWDIVKAFKFKFIWLCYGGDYLWHERDHINESSFDNMRRLQHVNYLSCQPL